MNVSLEQNPSQEAAHKIRAFLWVSFVHYPIYNRMQGHTVVQLVEALRYKPECRGFDSRLCHWKFSLT